MIEFTLGNAVAMVMALIGLAYVFNGIRAAFLHEVAIGAHEVAIGALLIGVAWFITTLGPLI